MKRTLFLLCLFPFLARAQAVMPLPPPAPVPEPVPTFTPHSGPRVGPIPPGPDMRKEYPRSPNTRILPASREPGIWAAEGAHRPQSKHPKLGTSKSHFQPTLRRPRTLGLRSRAPKR